MWELLFNSFIVLFVVVDPIGLAPMFAALTHGGSLAYKRAMAIKGTMLAAAVLVVFVLVGEGLFRALGIGLPAFRIAGGALLFLLAIDMVFARHSGLRSTTLRELEEAEQRKDISVFPLAIPLIAGPGAITTVLLLTGSGGAGALRTLTVLGVLAVVLLMTLISLLAAGRIMGIMGETGANVITRVLGIILAALAVQFILDGLQLSFTTTTAPVFSATGAGV
jgi:multiple antibiotic resistance protein